MNKQSALPQLLSLSERRRFLKALGAAAVAPLLGAGAVSAALSDGSRGFGQGAMPEVVRGPGGVFLVNGWVLTGADLAVLGLRAA